MIEDYTFPKEWIGLLVKLSVEYCCVTCGSVICEILSITHERCLNCKRQIPKLPGLAYTLVDRVIVIL